MTMMMMMMKENEDFWPFAWNSTICLLRFLVSTSIQSIHSNGKILFCWKLESDIYSTPCLIRIAHGIGLLYLYVCVCVYGCVFIILYIFFLIMLSKWKKYNNKIKRKTFCSIMEPKHDCTIPNVFQLTQFSNRSQTINISEFKENPNGLHGK